MDSIMGTITLKYNSNIFDNLKMEERSVLNTRDDNERNIKLDKATTSSYNDSSSKHEGYNRTRAEYKYHEDVNRISIKVIDEVTNEVIREIPPEKSIEILKKLMEIPGLFVDERR